MSLKMAHKVIIPPKKNYIPQFLKQRDINSYYTVPLTCYFSGLNRENLRLGDPQLLCTQQAPRTVWIIQHHSICVPRLQICLHGWSRQGVPPGSDSTDSHSKKGYYHAFRIVWILVHALWFVEHWLKVHKRDNFLGSKIEICTFS